MMGGTTIQALKTRFKRDLERYPESSRVRLHRAISWLLCAERESGDLDAQFVFLWIAFNAAYAKEFGQPEAETERDRLSGFMAALLALDVQRRLHRLMFEQFTGPIRTLIENKFVFEPFWRALREHDASGHWEKSFAASKKVALACVMKGETATVLSIVFDRLYVLRNQLIHGGATWRSSVNRAQMRDGVHILRAVVPVIVELMLDHPELDLGDILYPVV